MSWLASCKRRTDAATLLVHFLSSESVAVPPVIAEPSFHFAQGVNNMRPPLRILYAEDYKLLLRYVKEMLEDQGWRVEACTDGDLALEAIEGGNIYDLLILDNSLPGMTGLELVRRARRLAHRRRTPIIMLSASNAAKAARYAGVNAFLRKPDEIDALIETVRRLAGE